jgi:hypothetical protein
VLVHGHRVRHHDAEADLADDLDEAGQLEPHHGVHHSRAADAHSAVESVS